MSDSRVVAVIDDDVAVLDSLKFLLEVVGYAVVAYNSAAAFLDDRVTRPACLIVDQHMPLMTGAGTCLTAAPVGSLHSNLAYYRSVFDENCRAGDPAWA